MSETVYELMMKIGLDHSDAFRGFGAISTALIGLSKQATGVTTAFSGWGPALALVAGAAGIGLVVTGIETIIKKAEGLSDELVHLKNLGGDMAKAVDSGTASAIAYDIARRVPLKVEDIAKGIGTGYSLFGKEATPELVEQVANAQWVLQFNKHFKGDSAKDIQDLMRAGEQSGRLTDPITGKIDPAKVKDWLDLSQRVISGSHGLVTAQSLLGLTQQGGFALRGLSEKGFMGEAIMAQVMGGQRAGTATLGIMQQLSKGTMTGATVQGMEEAGLLKPGEWHMDKQKVVIDEEVRNALTKKFTNDPMDIAAEIIANLNAKGITDPTERLRRVLGAMGRQTTQRFTAEEVMNFEQQIAERDRWMQGAGVGKAKEAMMSGSLTANMAAFGNAWDNLLTALGTPLIGPAITVMKDLTSALNVAPDVLVALKDLGNVFLKSSGLPVILDGLTLGFKSLFAVIQAGGDALRWLDKLVTGNLVGKAGEWVTDEFKKHFFPSAPKQLIDPNVHPQRFEGDSPFGGASLFPANFKLDTGKQQQMLQPMTLTLNVDGDKLAESVENKFVQWAQFPAGPPEANGWDFFRSQGRHDSS